MTLRKESYVVPIVADYSGRLKGSTHLLSAVGGVGVALSPLSRVAVQPQNEAHALDTVPLKPEILKKGQHWKWAGFFFPLSIIYGLSRIIGVKMGFSRR